MKKLLLACLVLTTFLTACALSMYGVPQATWDRMSESERIATMRAYEREQQARRQAAEERAQWQAIERERERARQVERERARRERIESIHRGEGAHGELIRVRLQGGRIRVGNHHYRYEPATFTLADGETRKLNVALSGGRAELTVAYGEGFLFLDGNRFPYDRRWGRGTLYADTKTSGALELRGVDLFIEIHDRSSRHERELSRLVIIPEEAPLVVIPEKDHRRPPVVVIKEEKPRTLPVADRTPSRPLPANQPRSPAAEGPPHAVEVVLLSGEMKVRGQSQHLERATLRLAEGEIRNLSVKAGNETNTISLRYTKGELFIDSGPARGRDAHRLTFDKEWKTGKVYRFALKGKAPLEKVEMKVTGIEGK